MKTVHWLPSTVSSAFSPVRLHRGSLTTGTTRQPPDGDPLPNTLACRNVWEPGPVAHRRQAGDTVVHASASQPPCQKPGPHEVGQTPSSLLYRGSVSPPQSRSPGEGLPGTRRGVCEPCCFPPHCHLRSHPGSCCTASRLYSLPRPPKLPQHTENVCPVSPKCSFSPRTHLSSSKIPLLTPSSTFPP